MTEVTPPTYKCAECGRALERREDGTFARCDAKCSAGVLALITGTARGLSRAGVAA